MFVGAALTVLALSALPLWAAAPLQSAFTPASEQAAGIERLWWVMFWVAVIIFTAVMTLLIFGLYRGRKQDSRLSYRASRNLVLVSGVMVPLVTIIFLVGGSLMLGKDLSQDPPDEALKIRVTGWMWWWQIDYLDADGNIVATTANEMHVPVDQPVHVLLESADVIHSFWVPNLQGKTDMVPGRTNHSWFVANTAGTFRGQCAEFCGVQHALMSFTVTARPADEFKQWLVRQAADAAHIPAVAEGKRVFFQKECHDCHTIRGTRADGRKGPDLTHFASRETLAAVTRDNHPFG